MKNLFFIALMAIYSISINAKETKENQALLVGTSETSKNTIKFRTIDQGPILLDADYNLPSTVNVETGDHVFSVMCEFFYDDGSKLVPGTFKISIEDKKIYHLQAELSKDGNSCILSSINNEI